MATSMNRPPSGKSAFTQMLMFQFFQNQLKNQDCKIDSIEKLTEVMGTTTKKISKNMKKDKSKAKKKRTKSNSCQSNMIRKLERLKGWRLIRTMMAAAVPVAVLVSVIAVPIRLVVSVKIVDCHALLFIDVLL